MGIENLIANGIQPVQIESPLNRLAKFQQVKAGQMQLDQAERQQASTNAINEAWQESGGDINKLRSALIRRGQGSAVPGIEKMMATTGKAQADAGVATTKNVVDRMALSRQFLDTVNPNDPAAPQRFMQWNMANFNDPVLGPYLAKMGASPEKSAAQIQSAMRQPGGFTQLLNQSRMGIQKVMEMEMKQQGLDNTEAYRDKQLSLGERRADAAERNAASLESYRDDQRKLAQRESERKDLKLVDLPPQTRQKREAAYPKATMALNTHLSETNKLISDLKALRDSKGLSGITGTVYGRTPSAAGESKKANALYNKIMSRGTLSSLTAMRAASPTGGALGNVSDADLRILKDSFGGLDRTMDTKDFKTAVDDMIVELEGSKQRLQDAYDMDYEYRGQPASKDTSSTAGAPTGVDEAIWNVMTPEERALWVK